MRCYMFHCRLDFSWVLDERKSGSSKLYRMKILDDFGSFVVLVCVLLYV